MTKLSPEIVDLLAARVDSFEKLDIVVALHGAPRSMLTIDELCRSLGFPREVVRHAAVELHAALLVQVTSRGELHLLPPTKRELELLDELVRLYSEDRFALVKAMGDIALERLRTLASRTFGGSHVARKRSSGDES